MTQLLCSTSCTHSTGQQDDSGKQQCLKILFNFVLNNNKENDDDDDEDETVRTSQSVVANGSNWRVNKQRDRQTHRLSVWKRKEGSQLKRSRVKEDGGPHCVCCSLCGTGNSAYEWFFRSLSVFVLQIYCQRNVLSEVFAKFIWLACRLALYSFVPRCTRLAWLHAF